MGKLRFLLSQIICKIASFILKNIFKRGTNIPGVIAMKICPNALAYFKMPETVVCVTGTNGKTSTSNMLTHILRSSGKTVVNNSKGSNMASGLVAALSQNSTLMGKVKSDIAVLEVDERSSQYIYTKFTPTYILCTNLFRDSIKRNGHSEFIFDKIEQYIPKETTMVLNVNDAISGLLGSKNNNNKIYYGVDKTEHSTLECKNKVCDVIACPKCNNILQYEYYHYNHIGKPLCNCGFNVGKESYKATDVDFEKGEFLFNSNNDYTNLPFGNNLFNVFNVTACATMCDILGVDLSIIKEGIVSFTANQGRFKNEQAGELSIVTMLSKNQNPISTSQSIAYLNTIDGDKSVVLLITDSKDLVHGIEDISWLYDTDFEPLKDSSVKNIIIGGTRCYDLALKLNLSGVDSSKIKLYQSYETLKEKLDKNIVSKGTVAIFFELYAMDIANDIKKSLKEKLQNRGN